MAEGLLRARLAARGSDVTVDSAGLLPGGCPATHDAVAVLAGRDIDLAPHRSRNLLEVDLGAADLILGMERRHVQEAIVLVPEVRPRAFTLVDAVRRAEDQEPRRQEEPLAAWAARIGGGRTTADLLGVGDDEVDDPIGSSRARYEETAALLEDLLDRLVARAFPMAVSGP
jgi:protein-tyrosine phosphatase